jgi:hypothetical protein
MSNPRWPRWARIPRSGKILLGVSALGHIGLGMLKPSPTDWLFGIIPDAMEAARPWVWEQLGIRVPGQPSNPFSKDVKHGVSGRVGVTVKLSNGSSYGNYLVDAPFSVWVVKQKNSSFGFDETVLYFSEPSYPNGRSFAFFRGHFDIVSIDFPGSTVLANDPNAPSESPSISISPTGGIQPGTPPFSGMPAASRGQRPATDPRSYRPDIQAIPQTAPQPRAQTQAEPEPDQAATNCRFTPASQAERDALNDKIRDLNEEIRRILRENEDLRAQLATANQATFMQVPYVVENSEGKRVKQFYPITLKGLVDTTSEASLSNQTADWALQQGDKTERIYQILGGDQTWGNEPTPKTQVNPDAQLRAQPVISEQGLGQMMQFANLPQLFTATQAALYQRQGLQQFPITAQAPQLTGAGLLPDQATSQILNTATDVQMTTSNRGWAIVKGVNEVITKTKQTIEWLKIDRILNLLNFATTLHNALMLSNALGQTLVGIVDNVLATFGFAIKDATGNTISVGDVIGQTIENLIKSVVGADNYTNLKKEWAKANRIYQAATNLLFSLQSIGYSILSALEVVGSWVAWIGNALKRFGAVAEKAYPWMNPSPDFNNPLITNLNRVQEMLEPIEVISSETRSVTESVGELGRQGAELANSVKDGNKPEITGNTVQQAKADQARTASQSPIIPKVDLVRPEG